MKRISFLFVGLCLLIVVVGLFLLVNHAQATTYTFAQSSTGQTCTIKGNYNGDLLPAYQADLITSAPLLTKTGQTAKDTVWRSFTYKMRPCDNRTFMYGQFWIRVYSVVGAGSASIVVNCTNGLNGTSYQRNVSVTGAGIYQILGAIDLVSNSSSCRVTVFSGFTSFAYSVNQSRYGMFWRTGTHSYALQDGSIVLGNTSGGVSLITLHDFSLYAFNTWRCPGFNRHIFSHNVLLSPTYSNVSIWSDMNAVGKSVIFAPVGTLYTTDINRCSFFAKGNVNTISCRYDLYVFQLTDVFLHNVSLVGATFNCKNVEIVDTVYAASGSVMTLGNVIIKNAVTGLLYGTDVFNCNGVTFDNVKTIGESTEFDTTSRIYLTNCSSTTGFWNITGDLVPLFGGPNTTFYRAYYNDFHVNDNHTGLNLSGVSVKWYNNFGGLVRSDTTNVNGDLSVGVGYSLDYATLNDICVGWVLVAPWHVYLSKAGYQGVWVNFTGDKVSYFVVSMIPMINTSLTVTQNLVNCSVTHDYVYNPLTGFHMWINGTCPLVWFLHTINASVTHQQYWTGSQMNLYVNTTGNTTPIHTSDVKVNCTGFLSYILNLTGYWVTGNHVGVTTPISISDTKKNVTGTTGYTLDGSGYHVTSTHESTLTQFLNLINAVGTHEKFWDGTTWVDWANVTGNASSGGLNFLMDNPNPANASTVNLLEGNPGGLDNSVVVRFRNFTTPSATPPTTSSFVSTTDDGMMYGRNGNYNTAQSQGTATLISPTFPVSSIGQSFTGSGINLYTCYRGYFMFNTSALPDDAVIETAVLHFRLSLDATTTSDFNVTVQNGQPTYPHIPAVKTDYNKTHYSGNGGSVNTMTLGALKSAVDIPLNSNGISWMNKYGMTKFVLRSDRDISAVVPIGNEYVEFNTSDATTGHPYLTIYYHSPWENILNITYSSNSSGSWQPSGLVYAVQNMTYTIHNNNLSVNNTRYYWRTVTVCNGSVLDNQTWWFETGDLQSLVNVTGWLPSNVGDSGNIVKVGLFMGMGCCLAVLGSRRRKRKNQHY